MATIENQICEAIEAIAGNLISKANFDKTIQATIVACVDEAVGKYKVKYQDNTFYAYSSDIDKKYSKDNRVYILIPGNDMTRDKTILGTVGKTSQYSSTEAGTYYKKTSPNLIIQQNSKYEIYSGTEYNCTEPYERYGKEIYNYNHNNLDDIIILDPDPVLEYMKRSEYIRLGAKFKTNLPQNITDGEYGLNVFLLCGEGENTYTYIMPLDFSHGLIGEPYKYYQSQYRDYAFPKPENFIRIEKIEIFARGFETQLDNEIVTEDLVTEEMYDIEVSEIQIYSANKVDYTKINNGINMIYPKGTILLTTMTKLPVEAEVVEQGNILSPETNLFYWFKKDASVNSMSNSKYCSFGGMRWACLNEKTSSGWTAATNAFEFDTSHLTAYENKFKVVSYRELASQIVKHEEEFVLLNYNENTKITLTSNKTNNTTVRAVDDLNLVCNVTPAQTGATYRYYWNAEVHDMSWINHQDIVSNFDCIINNNQISNIRLRKLNETHNSITFTCTVIKTLNDQETTLGSASIDIIIESKLTNPYVLELVNGTQIFQYNELGEAPTVNGVFQPKPLTIRLLDNVNNEYINLDDAIVSGRMTIEWKVKEGATLIDTELLGETDDIGVGDSNTRYFKSFEYTLKSPFVYDGLDNNKIEVTVTYDDFTFVESTNFTFLTQGDSGTNGTQYSARIIPDTDNNNSVPRWVTFTTTGGTSGEFNFGPNAAIQHYTMDSGGCYGDGTTFPFRVQLLRNGEVIYDGKTGQASNGSQSGITIIWDMQVKTYSNGIKDKSNYQVVQPSGNQVLTMKYIKTMYSNNNQVTNTLEDLNHTPANILKCSIRYTPKIYQETEDGGVLDEVQSDKYLMIYATLPIVTIVKNNSDNIDFNIETGFSEVVYNRDACVPRYDSTKQEFEIPSNYSYSTCKWYIKGYKDISIPVSGKPTLLAANNLTIDSESNKTNATKRIIVPVFKFIGDSVTNAILFKHNSSYIHIPIDMHLNRFGLRMLNEWDGTSIELNNDGGYILAPQVGAGKKDSNNKFTGIIMGEAKNDSQKDMHPGLFAYNKSERTFALMADSGLCAIGKPGGSQIILDPTSSRGCIYSGEFFKQSAIDQNTGFVKSDVLRSLWSRYAGKNRQNLGAEDKIGKKGLLIDFTEGRIYSASGKFDLDENGNMICIEGHFSNKYYRLYNKDTGIKYDNDKAENYFVDLGKYDRTNSRTIQYSQYFLYCRPELSNYRDETVSFSVTKDGRLFSNSGEIGGFKINATNITSDTISKPFDSNGKSIITFSNEPFTRNKMNVVTPYKSSDMEFLPSDWENLTAEVHDEIIRSYDSNILTDDNILIDEDSLITDIIYPTSIVREIKLRKNQQVEKLLIAVGDDFGVTEEGIVYSREIYSRRACFEKFICKTLVVDTNAVISGNLQVSGHLYVKGNIKAKNIQTEEDIIAEGRLISKSGESCVRHLCCYGDITVAHSSKLMVSEDEDPTGGTAQSVPFREIYNKIYGSSSSGNSDDILNGGGGNSGLPDDDILNGGGGGGNSGLPDDDILAGG